jgi:hypothetical protein
MRYRLRTLFMLVALGPPLLASEPVGLAFSFGMLACVVAAFVVDATEAAVRRLSARR